MKCHNGENRVIFPGIDKTHLAIAFGVEVLAKGFQVLFKVADELWEQCQKALK